MLAFLVVDNANWIAAMSAATNCHWAVSKWAERLGIFDFGMLLGTAMSWPPVAFVNSRPNPDWSLSNCA